MNKRSSTHPTVYRNQDREVDASDGPEVKDDSMLASTKGSEKGDAEETAETLRGKTQRTQT